MDLGAHPIEQDTPLTADRRYPDPRRKQPRGHLLDDRPAELGARALAAVGDLERDRQDRFSARPGGFIRPGEQRREHGPPAIRIGGLPVHHGPGQDRLGRRSAADHFGRPGHQWVRLDAGVDDRPSIARRVLEPHGVSLRATRTTCG